MLQKDGETRTRVLEAATRLFAADGFKKVTVREICREASANVAAVNYHFGDKLGLYQEVMGKAMDVMRETTAIAQRDGDGLAAPEKLAAFIRVFVDRVVRHARDSWIHRLMTHEMTDPTPVLHLVEEQVLAPRMRYLAMIIAELLETTTDDPRVLRASLSVQSQFFFIVARPSLSFLPDVADGEAALDGLRDHITAFSTAGILALKDVPHR